MQKLLISSSFCAVLVISLAAPAAQAEPAPGAERSGPPSAEQRAAEQRAAEAAADAALIKGPTDIPLAERGTLHLPAGRSFVPKAEADRLMRAYGNEADAEELGLVLGQSGDHNWFAIVSYINGGHIKDDDARDLDAATLLRSLRANQEEANRDRIARGFPALTLGDWLQPPRYDLKLKRLVWSLPVWDVGKTIAEATINYNTRALGREGFFSLNLLTDEAHFDADKPAAEALLADLDYLPGQRYADFNASTDHVAEYGLAALIGVVALKKFGLIALATAFVLKFAKLGLFAVIGVVAALKRFVFGRKASKPAA